MKRTNIISTEEYIEMLKPVDSVYASRLEEGMKTFHAIDTESKE
jgi:hypothetical protein